MIPDCLTANLVADFFLILVGAGFGWSLTAPGVAEKAKARGYEDGFREGLSARTFLMENIRVTQKEAE